MERRILQNWSDLADGFLRGLQYIQDRQVDSLTAPDVCRIMNLLIGLIRENDYPTKMNPLIQELTERGYEEANTQYRLMLLKEGIIDRIEGVLKPLQINLYQTDRWMAEVLSGHQYDTLVSV